MKLFSSLLAMLLLLALAPGALAQEEEEEIEKDVLEVAVFFGGALPMGGITDWSVEVQDIGTEKLGTEFGFDAGFDVGYFWTTNFVTGMNFTWYQFTIDGEGAEIESMKHRDFSTSAYAKYYFFGESNLAPYIKGHAGVDVLKYTTRVWDPNVGGYEYRELSYDPVFAFGLGGGLFYYTHDYGGVYAEVNYHTALSEDAGGSYEGGDFTFGENASILDFHAGIKVFFGGE